MSEIICPSCGHAFSWHYDYKSDGVTACGCHHPGHKDSAKTIEKAECERHPSEEREQHEGPPARVVAATETRGRSSGRVPTGGDPPNVVSCWHCGVILEPQVPVCEDCARHNVGSRPFQNCEPDCEDCAWARDNAKPQEPTRDEVLDALFAIYISSNPESIKMAAEVLRRAGRLK